MMKCNNCDARFSIDELKLTDSGFGCPECGSICYNKDDRTKKWFKWDEVKVIYQEGHHD